MIWVILGLFALAIAGFAMVSSDNGKKDAIAKKLAELPDFTPERTLIKTSMSHGQRGLSLDSQTKKACLIVQDSLLQVPFSDILESEILVDGATVTKTSRTSQAIGTLAGGALLGGVGAVIGGLSGNTTSTQQIKNVVLRVVVNNMQNPVHDIGFIELGYTGGDAGRSRTARRTNVAQRSKGRCVSGKKCLTVHSSRSHFAARLDSATVLSMIVSDSDWRVIGTSCFIAPPRIDDGQQFARAGNQRPFPGFPRARGC